MATTTAPPPTAPLNHPDLRRFLGALRAQLWWRDALLIVAASALVGALLGILAVVWPTRGVWSTYGSMVAGWSMALAIAIGLGLSVLRRPTVIRAARVADRQLATASRLATAAEVLDGRLGGSLAPAQLDDAWRLARGIAPARAYPHHTRRVQMALLAVAISAAAVALSLAGALSTVTISGLPALGEEVAAALAPDEASPGDAAATPSDAEALAGEQSKNPAGAAQTLEDLQSQAAQSQAAQSALQKLADSLRPTAAARDVGEALRAGNYDDAAQKLQNLGQNSDQLSRLSKRELASAMERAARDSVQLDPPLAVAEDRVAKALNRQVYSETRNSLDNLARAVGDAKNGIISQEALARELDQLQQQQQPTPGGGGGDIGESEQGYIPDIPGENPTQPNLVQGITSTISIPGPEGDPNKTNRSSVGQEAGGDPLGDITSRLDVPPVDITVDTQLVNDQGRNRANPQAPTVKISDTSQTGVRTSDVVQPGDPVQDVAERSIEPTEARGPVRAFFKSVGDTATPQGP